MEKNKLGNKKLWNLVANSAKNVIEAGGWFSSYTNTPFSENEMLEYVKDVEEILTKVITTESTILEIGCSSGITMTHICPKVRKYIGIDISSREIEWCRKSLNNNSITNYELFELSADKIDTLEYKFDGIILNSVVHCFDSIEYLLTVLKKSCNLIDGHGFVYIGDVMDLEKKEQLLNSLFEFKKMNPQARTKTKIEHELMVSQRFFSGLPQTISCIKEVEFYSKRGTLENELKKYRYNVMLKVNKK